MDADIVITTYNTLATEYKSKPSILHDIEWYRLVLDEGLSWRSPFSVLSDEGDIRFP